MCWSCQGRPDIANQLMTRDDRFRWEMPDEEVPNEFSVTEKENEEIDENTDRFRQDGKLQGKYLVDKSIKKPFSNLSTSKEGEHSRPVRFHSITRQTFHKAHAFLLMYDVTSSQSFSAVSYWASCIQEGAAEGVTILLIGNKSDGAERQVQTQEAEILAKKYNFEFMECSAATGENVVQSLETVARMLSQKVDTRGDTMVLHKEPQPKTSRCC
ncbi:Ras-related protein Rab-44 [Liparis tanakae]|uniref:Ras-related protein Rab-44 n=1 Tax=Liparis tanakae TaxID=230148 RepID=A0A4Z2J365_9TELE|nr:Ras-related protein Rab-44 [Liparis tanakae]